MTPLEPPFDTYGSSRCHLKNRCEKGEAGWRRKAAPMRPASGDCLQVGGMRSGWPDWWMHLRRGVTRVENDSNI